MDDARPLPTQPLRATHRDLLADVALLRATADLVDTEPDDALCDLLDGSVRFLVDRLVPYVRMEARLLYPILDEMLGTAAATGGMSRDLLAVVSLTEELAFVRDQVRADGLRPDRATELRRVLYELHGILRLHCMKEEELLSLLDGWLDADRSVAVARNLQEGVAAVMLPPTGR